MRFIKKGPEPESFMQWKNDHASNPGVSYERLRNPVKATVHHALVREQGFICCYCCNRITLDKHHIEHFRPKAHYPKMQLDYANLLACCQGGIEEAPPRQLHCGHKKGDWYDEELMVSPTSPDCGSYFRYTSLGEILPTDDESRKAAGEATIEHLGLENEKLTAARKRALDAVLEVLDKLTEDQGRRLIRTLGERDSSGKYTPFCSAIVHVLKQYFSG